MKKLRVALTSFLVFVSLVAVLEGSAGVFAVPCEGPCVGHTTHTAYATTSTTAKFDFRLYNSGSTSNLGGVRIARGKSGTITVTVALVNGPTQTVTLSCNSQANGKPLPLGVSCSPTSGTPPITRTSGTPPFTRTLTITVSSSTAPGYYTIKASGTAGSLTRSTLFTLDVT